MRTRLLATMLLGLSSGACAVGPNFHAPTTPDVSSYSMNGDDPAWTNISLAPSADMPTAWWSSFGSHDIDALVAQALANNQTLAEADANLRVARANAQATVGGAFPQVNSAASAVRERINTQAFGFTGFPSPTISLYSVGASVNFDLDIFGGHRRAIERDEARAVAQQARVDAAYLTLSGNVVREAVLLAGLRAKLAAHDQIVQDDNSILGMVHRAIQAGGQPPAASNTIEAQLAEDEAAGPPLRQQYAEARHRLALYVGRAPADWTAPDLDLASLSAPTQIPVSLPSALVRKRPDILAAEADVHAATANIGVQTASLYPNLSINPTFTQSAIDPSAVFQSTSAGWSIGPSLTAPIFHGGTLRAQVRAANAEQRAALAAYQETVLEAFVQVADVIQSVGNSQQAVEIQTRAVATADANVRNTRVAYENGATSLLTLVDAQRQANRARLAAVDAQVALYQNIAALYVAAAADWRTHTP